MSIRAKPYLAETRYQPKFYAMYMYIAFDWFPASLYLAKFLLHKFIFVELLISTLIRLDSQEQVTSYNTLWYVLFVAACCPLISAWQYIRVQLTALTCTTSCTACTACTTKTPRIPEQQLHHPLTILAISSILPTNKSCTLFSFKGVRDFTEQEIWGNGQVVCLPWQLPGAQFGLSRLW